MVAGLPGRERKKFLKNNDNDTYGSAWRLENVWDSLTSQKRVVDYFNACPELSGVSYDEILKNFSKEEVLDILKEIVSEG